MLLKRPYIYCKTIILSYVSKKGLHNWFEPVLKTIFKNIYYFIIIYTVIYSLILIWLLG